MGRVREEKRREEKRRDEKRRDEKRREERREEKRSEEREEERRSEKRKNQKKEDAGARKGSNVAKHCVFSQICASGRSKSRLAKAAGGEPSGQMRDEKLHAVVALAVSEHFFEVRMWFCVAGARDSAPCQKSAKRDVSVYNGFKMFQARWQAWHS